MVTLRRTPGDIVRIVELRNPERAEQRMSMPARQHRWTIDEVEHLADEQVEPSQRYELVDGHLLVTPSPTDRHQRIVGRIRSTISTRRGPTRAGARTDHRELAIRARPVRGFGDGWSVATRGRSGDPATPCRRSALVRIRASRPHHEAPVRSVPRPPRVAGSSTVNQKLSRCGERMTSGRH